ncbi:SpaH/EbpB family LPXTG-anchored major pilin [Enterococcus sp. AZ109]|uniref:SpaH/EbpB family LPXTG-anchored major pilin n=1 Tax=Enterococcus sp. AZ109 TaxID=2774634 RepID=UPI003F24C69A
MAKPADPFFVYVPQTDRTDLSSLIYDVQVQPKNILNSLIDPVKTIEGNTGYSIKAGQKFTWEATANIPNGLYTVASQTFTLTPIYDDKGAVMVNPDGSNVEIPIAAGQEIYANYFRINDTLAAELLLDDVVAQVRTGTGDWTSLILGTDYKVSVNGVEKTTAPVTDDSTGEKPVRVELTQAGMKKVGTANNTEIRVLYDTHTAIDFNGIISNHFGVEFLSPGLKPLKPENDKDPEYYTGGFDIEKTASDKTAPNDKLAGAEFHLAASEADAKAGKFIATNGNSYVAADLPNGVTFLTATSNGQGRAEFNGLALTWYHDANENGEQDADEPTFTSKADIKRDYWVVETKSPKDYELLKAPQKVTVDLSTEDDVSVELEVINKPTTDLPFTGGENTMLLVAIALGAITIGTVAIVIDKKRRAA